MILKLKTLIINLNFKVISQAAKLKTYILQNIHSSEYTQRINNHFIQFQSNLTATNFLKVYHALNLSKKIAYFERFS